MDTRTIYSERQKNVHMPAIMFFSSIFKSFKQNNRFYFFIVQPIFHRIQLNIGY